MYIPNCKPFHIFHTYSHAHYARWIHFFTPKAMSDQRATLKAKFNFKSHHVALRSKQIDIPHNLIHQSIYFV